MQEAIDLDEVILEFVRVGPLIRVSAMEPKTLTEVVIYGPAHAGEAALRRIVLRKLDYVLGRRHDTQRHQRQPNGKSVASD